MRKLIYILIAVLLLSASAKMMAQLAPNGLPLYEKGELYVQLRLNSTVAIHHKDTVVNDPGGSFQTLFTKYQVIHTEIPFASLNNPALNKTYKISFTDTARVDSFIIDLSLINTHVEYAEKIPAVYSFIVPNDPLSVQSGTYTAAAYYLPLLNADQASNIHNGGNALVAIVDDAVVTTHDDLLLNIGSISTMTDVADGGSNPNPPFSGYNAASASNGIFTHGTYVAGITGAVTGNGIGIASMGGSNKLMCVKASSNTPLYGGLHRAYEGIEWAAINGVNVINISAGSYAPSITHYTTIAWIKSNYDVILVAAAGNEAWNTPAYPAAYGEGTSGLAGEIIDKNLVVAVAALDQNNNIGVWPKGFGSNYGHWVDIAAYGTNILTTAAASSSIGTAITNTYRADNGTSLAAPMISSILGVMRSFDMSKSADEVINCLINTANPDIYTGHPLNPTGMLGSGRADAYAALRCMSSSCAYAPIAIISSNAPNLCANTTVTLTANQGNSYLWSTGATTQTITINSPGVYSVAVSYTGVSSGCTATTSIVFSPPPTLTLSLSTNTSICTGFSVNLVSASGNYSALVWQPGGLTTNSAVINPTAYTVYSVTANPGCGGSTQTIGINPVSGTQPSFSLAPVLGSTLFGNYGGGYYILNSDALINTMTQFNITRILFAPNVKITAPTSSTLYIIGSHLRTCGADMWKGIELADGSELYTTEPTLIEDAITAISTTHTPLYSSGSSPAKIWLNKTIFNKNYIDISLTDYKDFLPTTPTYSNLLTIESCVFTCRQFSIPWISFNARNPTAQSNNTDSPHIMYNGTAVNLKSPYTNQPSHIAIKLNSVGITTNNVYYGVQIGNDANANKFNLFDSHGKFIEATNSNVRLVNNVFQNTKTYTTSTNLNFGGIAIDDKVNLSQTKMQLNLAPASASVGNRFWDCKQAILGTNVFDVDISYNTFRSTQNSSNTASAHTGITLNTYQFEYHIISNEFTNIANCINIPLSALKQLGSGKAWVNNVFAYGINISANTFSAASSTGGFINKAVNVSGSLGFTWQKGPVCNWAYVDDYGAHHSCRGIYITDNVIKNAFRGVYLNYVSDVNTRIDNNTIDLIDDNIYNVQQNGISVTNCQNSKYTATQIKGNSVSGSTTSVSNPLMSLVFNGTNMGLFSPNVSCNTLQQSHKGFVFRGPNNGTAWLGNVMEPMTQGLRLEFNGEIGKQGTASTAGNNEWNGTWAGAHTFVDNSNAAKSPLYVGSGSNLSPTNNGGPISLNNFGAIATIYTVTGGDYQCLGNPNDFVLPVPTTENYSSAQQFYIAKTALYRFLHVNDSLREAHDALDNFYDGLANSNVDKLVQLEQKLYEGDADAAATIYNALDVDAEDTVEVNFVNYYGLCLNYMNDLDAETKFSEADSTALYDLAALCPGTQGSCVYQARGVYNSIYDMSLDFNDCEEASARMMNAIDKNVKNQYDVALFPNPASNQIIIISKNKSEDLKLTVNDVMGKTIISKNIKTKGDKVVLDLDLINGVYFIIIVNSNNETVTKKLLIAK